LYGSALQKKKCFSLVLTLYHPYYDPDALLGMILWVSLLQLAISGASFLDGPSYATLPAQNDPIIKAGLGNTTQENLEVIN